MEFKKRNNGITMVALIITIIILLILAGISIGVLTGENGLIRNAKEAKEQAEISNEREIINQATIKAMKKERYGSISKENLQDELNEVIKERAEVIEVGKGLEVLFKESNRYYEIDKDGNIGEYKIVAQDKYPGDITRDENGNILDGSEEKPYEINCIEDLVAFSNMTNGTGIKLEGGNPVEITTQHWFSNSKIILKRNLNFLSKYSYINSERTDFGDINGNDSDGNVLITEMATEKGFKCINIFEGNFDGKNNIIENIYVDTLEENVGFFRTLRNGAKISNLSLSGEIIGKSCVGGIVGLMFSGDVTMENCFNRCKVVGNIATGGICGRANGINGIFVINNCINQGIIISNEATGGSGFGGIVGVGYLKMISNCVNEGDVYINVSNYMNTGGIIGFISGGTIENSYNTGNIIGEKCLSKGGIIGTIESSGTVCLNNVYNKGKIENASMLGSIVGYIAANGNLEMTNVTYKSEIENAIGKSLGTVTGEATIMN